MIGDCPAPLSNSLRALLLKRRTAVRVAFECGHLELLDGLRSLRIESYSMPVLPGGLGRLAQLEAFSLIRGCLEEIPEEIALLGELSSLYANYQRLHTISPAIGRLGRLQELFLPPQQNLWIKGGSGRLPSA